MWDSTTLCNQLHCTPNGSYAYLHQIAIKSTSLGLWPRLKYPELGVIKNYSLGDTVNKFYCRSDDSQNLFADLLLKPILQIQGIWDKEWHEGSSHMEKGVVYCTVDSLVINGKSNRKVIENYLLLLGSVYYNYLLLEDFDYLLLITGYYFENWSITYYFSITYYLLPHVWFLCQDRQQITLTTQPIRLLNLRTSPDNHLSIYTQL